MLKINDKLEDKKELFIEKGVLLPEYDIEQMKKDTTDNVEWLHFGGGNLYRCFHAKIAQDLLNKGLMKSGIVVVETLSNDLIENVYKKYDNKSLSVVMKDDDSIELELIASTANAYYWDNNDLSFINEIKSIFRNDSLKMVSVTITEKGYQIKDANNEYKKDVQEDLKIGPKIELLHSTMARIAALLYERYQANAKAVAMISTDNFSENGDRFREYINEIINAWLENNLVDKAFVEYVNSDKVSFNLSMIDRITPFPSTKIKTYLEKLGFEDIEIDKSNSYAAFVNTEECHYLVVEDKFPNGRLALDRAGVLLADYQTVKDVDLMKVCSCLNPLHTSLAILGCLLAYTKISDEMRDNDLKAFVTRMGYDEALKVVNDPKIIDPNQFIDEVLNKRLVNANIPDTPQRIACDTSQKVGIRFGNTIKAYVENSALDVNDLRFIPLTIACWLRYLLAIDDSGNKFMLSSDPLLNDLTNILKGIEIKANNDVELVKNKLQKILSNDKIFGVDLYAIGLANKIEDYFLILISDYHKVRALIQEELKVS